MIGNTLVDYINIRISIAALRLITPLSITYLLLCAFKPDIFIVPIALYAFLEAAFYLLVYLPRSGRLQAPPTHPPPQLTREKRAALFQRCLQAGLNDNTINAPYPSGWFLPKDSKPKREDVIDWLLWALFSTSRELINIQEYEDEINDYIKRIEAEIGSPFPSGRSKIEDSSSMRINIDPVLMMHRPLVWYFIVAVVDTYTSVVLASLGFRHFRPVDKQWNRTFPPRPVLSLLSQAAPKGAVIPYWYRPHTSKSKTPLLFLHGIGIGLFPYLPFFSTLLKEAPDVGILLPELMSICMHMTPRSVPPMPLFLTSLNTILESLDAPPMHDSVSETQPLLSNPINSTAGWSKVVLAGHSYGTFVSGWILRQLIDLETAQIPKPLDDCPSKRLVDKISHTILIDPIPILLSNPTVAHNFLYRDPWTVCSRRLGSHQDLLLDEETGAPTSAIIAPAANSPSWYSSAAAWQLWYFASRDPDIARTLFRTFFWTEGGIWKEEIAALLRKRGISVFLAGMDQVVPAEAVRRYLTGEERWCEHWAGDVRGTDGNLEVIRTTGDEELQNVTADIDGRLDVYFNPQIDHAVLFDDAKWTSPLVQMVHRYTGSRR